MDEIPEYFERLIRLRGSGVKALIVRSALNPMLWLCAFVPGTFLIAAVWFRESPPICVALIATAVLPVVITCLGFVGLAIFRPDRLQSEEFQVTQQVLAILQQKGPIAVEAAALKAIANPLIDATAPTVANPDESA